MINGCPGAGALKGTPTLAVKICPECGSEIELFSVEPSGVCRKCGFTAYNETQTCAMWCAKARECLGDELFEKLFVKEE